MYCMLPVRVGKARFLSESWRMDLRQQPHCNSYQFYLICWPVALIWDSYLSCKCSSWSRGVFSFMTKGSSVCCRTPLLSKSETTRNYPRCSPSSWILAHVVLSLLSSIYIPTSYIHTSPPSQMPSCGVKAQHQAVNLHKTLNFTYIKFKSFSHFEDSFIVILGSQSHFLRGDNFTYPFTMPPSMEACLNHVKAHLWVQAVLYSQRPLVPC